MLNCASDWVARHGSTPHFKIMKHISEYSPLILGIVACCLTVYLLGVV